MAQTDRPSSQIVPGPMPTKIQILERALAEPEIVAAAALAERRRTAISYRAEQIFMELCRSQIIYKTPRAKDYSRPEPACLPDVTPDFAVAADRCFSIAKVFEDARERWEAMQSKQGSA